MQFSFAGLEFGLILSATVFFGALASAVALPDDDTIRETLLEFLRWTGWTFTALGIVLICSPISSSALAWYQWLTRGAVFALLLKITGISAQIEGMESVRRSPKFSEWQEKLSSLNSELQEAESAFALARREYDECNRQRDGLHIQLRIDAKLHSPIEIVGLTRRLRHFCDFEWRVLQDWRTAAEKLSNQIVNAREQRPTLEDLQSGV